MPAGLYPRSRQYRKNWKRLHRLAYVAAFLIYHRAIAAKVIGILRVEAQAG
jgi:DMSO/TMAO reductase YedYZ heme-binding membrane subunit